MEKSDQGRKRVALINHIVVDLAGNDGYYAQWDADDILHPDTVRFILQDNNSRGYLIDNGVMADFTNKRFAWLAPRYAEASKAFWRMCGSCSFVRFDFRSQSHLWKEVLMRLSSHKGQISWMDAYGLSLMPLPFLAAIYHFNHTENHSSRKGRTDQRNAYIDRNPLNSEDVSQITSEFKLSHLM